MKKTTIKILLVQITNKNFGDSVIGDNARYLLKKSFPLSGKGTYDILDYSIGIEDIGQVKYVDAVVFAGGGLIKFRQEQLYRQVSDIICEAQRYDVPVFLNSVGVEGFDAQDERCMQIKNAINLPCVKGISVRDDIQTLREHYIENKNIRVTEVYDPAIWSEETYKDVEAQHFDGVVGLGIAREDLFRDYGIEQIDRPFLLEFWKNLVEQLEKRRIKWMIFTNGLDADEGFAEEVLQYIGHGQKLEKPVNQLQLIKHMKSFDGVIACRMHSNIIAYALGIPSLGLVWNEKMIFWGEKIGYPERFITSDRLKPQYVVQVYEEAVKEGTRKPSYWKKRSVCRELRYFVRHYCRKNVDRKESPMESLDFSKHMLAAAMGGAEYKYKNMNHLGQLLEAVEDKKYRMIEVDVRMSSDQSLVCVSGWNKSSFKMMGMETEEVRPLTEQEFLDKKYYQFYETASFCQFAEVASRLLRDEDKKDTVFVLDVGKPSVKVMEEFYRKLLEILREYQVMSQNLIVKVERTKDVKVLKNLEYDGEISYYVNKETVQPEKKELLEEILQFCSDNNIKVLSMSNKSYHRGVLAECKKHKLQTMVLSFTKISEMLEALEDGVDFVGSHYYGVDYLERLTKG